MIGRPGSYNAAFDSFTLLFAPAGVPEEVVQTMSDARVKVGGTDAYREMPATLAVEAAVSHHFPHPGEKAKRSADC